MPDESAPGHFPATEWTLVLDAGSDATRSASALETLCRSYWQPLYAFARRKGYAPEASEDAVQGFLESILARRSLANVERDGRRFRSWLLGGFTHHLAHIYRRDHAQRRGKGVVPVSMDEAEAALPADSSLTPDQAYDRRWVELILSTAVQRLREQHERTGKADLWATLEPCVTGRSNASYATVAATLGITEQAVAVQIHRLRQRLRTLVRSEIARTVQNSEDLDSEMAYLLGLLQRR